MAFVLGNIEPDLNVFTYLHGMTHYEKLRGHSYDNVLPSMERLLKKIERRKYFGIRGYYLLGKVMHYTADIFTFPHNKEYSGTLLEHRQYEEILHEIFRENIKTDLKKTEKLNTVGKIIPYIKKLHKEYLADNNNCFSDCEYIFKATWIVVTWETALIQLAESNLTTNVGFDIQIQQVCS